MMYPGYGIGFGIISLIFYVLLWVLMISLIVAVVRWIFGNHHHHRHMMHHDHSLQILNERYARGEIDKQEYEEKKKNLMRGV